MDTPIAGSASSVDRLYLFYADLLDGQTNAEDSKVIQVLRDAFKFELLLRKFTLKQQLKIRNVKSEIDRCVKLLNMLILEFIVEKYEQSNEVKGDKIVESRGEFGKPQLENRKYQFNLSDEKGLVMLAIGFDPSKTNTEIGVDLANPEDIEDFNLNKLEDFYKLDFRNIFDDSEIEQLDACFQKLEYDKRLSKLSQFWALKESYSKYLGVGIAAGLQNYIFSANIEIKPTARLNEYQLDQLEPYEPRNVCLTLPGHNILCSVFAHYNSCTLVKLNPLDIVNHFLN